MRRSSARPATARSSTSGSAPVSAIACSFETRPPFHAVTDSSLVSVMPAWAMINGMTACEEMRVANRLMLSMVLADDLRYGSTR